MKKFPNSVEIKSLQWFLLISFSLLAGEGVIYRTVLADHGHCYSWSRDFVALFGRGLDISRCVLDPWDHVPLKQKENTIMFCLFLSEIKIIIPRKNEAGKKAKNIDKIKKKYLAWREPQISRKWIHLQTHQTT